MKQLLTFLKPYRKEAVTAPLFKLLEACMDLIVPLVVAEIINIGITRPDRGYIIRCFILLIALAVLGMAFSFTSQYLSARASVGFATDLRQALFDHIQTLSFAELDRLGTDTLITRMTSDVGQIQNGLNLSLRLLLRSPFIVFGAMVMAFTIDVRCALIFAAAIPVLSAVVFAIMLKSIPLFARVQQTLDRLLGKTRENLTGVRVIRAFRKEETEIREFDECSMSLTKMNESVGRLSALMNPATYLLINTATIVLIRVGAVRISSGSLLQGDLVALYNYMAQIIVELVKLASLIITINRSLACAGRVSDMMSVSPSINFGKPAVQTAPPRGEVPVSPDSAVSFRSVSFSYAGSGEDAVQGITFDVKKGQTVGVIGGTGCGKSTIMNLIPRFYDATEGRVLVNGRDVRDYPEHALTEIIGVVPQKAVLFEGTIRSNLRWGNEAASDEDLWEALRTAQAEEMVRGREGMLDARVEQGGRNLSGGQRQRLTIARALVKKPEILIMDDSASALDFATDLRLRRAVRDLGGGMTVFIVSQRTSSVRAADLILVLDDGLVAGQGTHDSLLRDCPVYREIFYSQFPEERPGKEACS